MNQIFKRTPKQIEQTAKLSGQASNVMCYGGSRSGKTFGICRALVIRACKVKSRHAALRFKFNHAKTSLWYETFPKVFDLCFPDLSVTANKTDWFYQFPNGSEIWIGGLDEKERVEKILGKEYSTIYFNECSQIPYTSVAIAMTRLAEKNSLKKRAWFDENPPEKKHWSYPLFIKGLDPDTWEPKKDSSNYTSILMNPEDNKDNIDDNYMSVLDALPEKDRLRFKHGEFSDGGNSNIYYAFDREKHVRPIIRDNSLPLVLGMDFNVSPLTSVICQVTKDTIYVLDEVYLNNSNTNEAADHIQSRFPGRWTVIPDSTGNALKTSSAGLSDHQILRNKGFNIPAVQNPFRMDRYNAVNNLFEKTRIVIDPKCVKLIKDLEKVSFKEGTNLPETKDLTLTHISDALGYLVHWFFPIVLPNTGVAMVDR